jgi:hypothetical protein
MSDDTALAMFSDDDFKSPFDFIMHTDDDGNEFWYARELMSVLEYSEWRFFKPSIERAKRACEKSGFVTKDHFVVMHEMVTLGSGSQRKVDSYRLSRYACYLTALNGDTSRPMVARAQTYFLHKARQAELRDQYEAEQRKLKRGRAVTGYLNDGRSKEWANKRVDSKASVARLNGAAQDTHETNSPDFGALHGEINKGALQMTKDEIVSYLGLRPADAPKFRDHLGQYALDTLVQINHAASTKMNQFGRPLTADEQLTIIRDVVAILAPTMRALAAYVQVDFVSGAPVDEYGRPQILRNLPLLGAAS